LWHFTHDRKLLAKKLGNPLLVTSKANKGNNKKEDNNRTLVTRIMADKINRRKRKKAKGRVKIKIKIKPTKHILQISL
jgi:hypothetical protein